MNDLVTLPKAADALRTTLRNPTADFPALDAGLKQAGQRCAACPKACRNEKQ